MSADNTIIILELKNEYRVVHIQAADNLYWHWGFPENTELVEIRIFESFHSVNPILSKKDALEESSRLYDLYNYVEYGIQSLKINFSFNEIAHIALEQAEEEVSFIYNDENLSKEKKIMFAEELKDTRNEILGWIATNE